MPQNSSAQLSVTVSHHQTNPGRSKPQHFRWH